MNPALTIRIITHTILWLFVFSVELTGEVILKDLPQTSVVNVVALLLTVAGFGLVCRLGQNALLRDIQELYFYDVLLQSYGAWAAVTQHRAPWFAVLVGAILLLKFFRLLWLDDQLAREADTGWPVFGLIGYFHQRRRGNVPTLRGLSRRDYAAWACILATFPLSFLFNRIGVSVIYLIFGIALILIISFYFQRFITYLEQTEQARLEAEKKLAVATATAALNEELREKHVELQYANREMDGMLADLSVRNEYLRDASHDLAAPAFWVTACAQALTTAPDEASRKVSCAQLLDSVAHYNQLLQATIHGAKLVTGIEQPGCSPILVGRLANYLWEKYLPLFRDKGLRFGIYKANLFVLHADGSVSPEVNPEPAALQFYIDSDEQILMRILNNLLTNALRNTTRGRVRVAFRQRKDGTCWIEVRDSGSGFAGAASPDWAANFNTVALRLRAGGSRVGTGGGHGLGINNIRNLCVAIDSTMLLKSRLGQGSVFRFAVPLTGTPPAGMNRNPI